MEFSDMKKGVMSVINYIISRNYDIKEDFSIDVLEYEDATQLKNCGDRFYITANGRFFSLDFTLTLKDANYLKNNELNITYIMSDKNKWDSVVGSIDNFCNENNIKYSNYIRAIVKLNGNFTKGMIKTICTGDGIA